MSSDVHFVEKEDYHAHSIDLFGRRFEFWRVRWDIIAFEILNMDVERKIIGDSEEVPVA